MASLDVLYFGEIRERLGRDVDHVDPPSHVLTIRDLVEWLSAKGERYREALADPERVRAAVDREHARAEDSFFGAQEVALFPPVGAL